MSRSLWARSRRSVLETLFCTGLATLLMGQPVLAADAAIPPPKPARVDVVVESVQGVEVRDPYRWMEKVDGKEFATWAVDQKRYADAMLAQAGSQDALSAKISEALQAAPTLGTVYPMPGSVLTMRWLLDGQELHVLMDGANEERLLVSQKMRDDAGRGRMIRRVVPSWDGRYLAITATGPGDLGTKVSVFDLRSGAFLPDRIDDLLTTTSGSRYQVVWLPDSSGFVYPRLAPGATTGPSGELYARGRQFLHRLGTPNAENLPVFGYGVDPAITMEIEDLPSAVAMAPGSPWIVARLARNKQDTAELWAARIDDVLSGHAQWRRVSDDGHGSPQLRGDRVYALTSLGADRRRIVARDLANAASDWVTVVPEREGVIRDYQLAGDGALYFSELREAREWLYRSGADGGKAVAITVPIPGSLRFAAYAGRNDGLWVEVSNWVNPGGWFRVAPDSTTAVPAPLAPGGEAPMTDDLIVEQLMIPAADGARIPVSIVRPRGRALDGTMPLLLESYGSFGKIQTPEFNPYIALWVRQGAVYAYAHVRGGGELGEAWHRAALRETKSITTTDVLAVAQALVERGYTRPEKSIYHAMSNGAQPVGMALIARPQQFGTVVYNVGQPDDLRGALMDPTSARNLGELGDTWTKEGVALLLRNSPYYQLPEQISLPNVVVKSAPDDYNYGSAATTAKYVARLQAANRGSHPVIWVHQPGGHSWLFDGNPDQDARLMAWLLRSVGASP